MGPMLIAFMESIKYMGHLWPLALVRMFIGYQFFQTGLEKWSSGYLVQPYFNETIRLGMQTHRAPDWYAYFFESFVQQNWQLFAYILTGAEILVGLSYLLGFGVRTFSILATLLTFNAMWAMGAGTQDYYQLLLLFHLLFFALGAGRCLGLDYYFFRSRRGLWW